jgi:cysteine synthase A
VLNRQVLDEIMSVSDEDAIAMSRRLSREEGLLIGVSAGANVVAALKVAKRLGRDKRVVTVLPDTGERYLTMEA